MKKNKQNNFSNLPVFISVDCFNMLIGTDDDASVSYAKNLLEINESVKITFVSLKSIQELELPDSINVVTSISLELWTKTRFAYFSKKPDENILEKCALHKIIIESPEIEVGYHMGALVVKGDLLMGISSKGKAIELEHRIAEYLGEVIPHEFDKSIENWYELKNKTRGDLSSRVQKMNQISGALLRRYDRKWHEFDSKKVFFRAIGVITLLVTGHIIFSLVTPTFIWNHANSVISSLDTSFLYYMLGGFIAQMIDGALGMAYGVSATTFLLSFGISPAVASMSVHASEIFTSGVSGLMHLKFGNVHNKLFKAIVIPGVLGAILGAYILTEFENYSSYIKPIVGVYTLILGCLIIYKVLRKSQKRKRVKNAGYLAVLGGFLDSIGGGGWGPVVSSTLIASGKHPRLVVGSVNLAEFFVSLASSFTFITILGGSHWQTILGLILGGVCAAPIAASISRKLNIKAMMLMVGIVVIIVSLRIIIISILA